MTRSLDNIVDWLLDSAPTHTSLRSITDGLVDKLREAGVPVDASTSGYWLYIPRWVGTPSCESGMEASFEVPVRREDGEAFHLYKQPIRFVVEENQPVDFDLMGPILMHRFQCCLSFATRASPTTSASRSSTR